MLACDLDSICTADTAELFRFRLYETDAFVRVFHRVLVLHKACKEDSRVSLLMASVQ